MTRRLTTAPGTWMILWFCMAAVCWSATAEARDPGDMHPDLPPDRSTGHSVNHLYFSNKIGTFLTAEDRTLPMAASPEAHGAAIVRALISGPRKGLMRTLPPATRVRAFYVTRDKTAVVDLTAAVGAQHPGGVQMERLSI